MLPLTFLIAAITELVSEVDSFINSAYIFILPSVSVVETHKKLCMRIIDTLTPSKAEVILANTELRRNLLRSHSELAMLLLKKVLSIAQDE